MVHGTVRALLRLLEAIGFSLLVLAALAAWRLSRGPVALDVLTPYVEEALSLPDGSFRVEVERTMLTWAGWDRALDLRAAGVNAISADKGVIAAVPEVSLSLSGAALLRGVVAPRTVEVIGPKIWLYRDADGNLHWGFGDSSQRGDADPVVSKAVQELIDPANPDSPAGHLHRVKLQDAELTIEDARLGLTWRAPDADLLFARDQGGLAADIHVLIDAAGQLSEVAGRARYVRAAGAVDARLTVRDLRPDVFARVSERLAPLAALDLPLSGVVEARVDVESGLQRLDFDIAGGAGLLRLPAPVGTDYPVAALEARGSVTDMPGRLVLDELRIDLGGPVISASALADIEGFTTVLKGSVQVTAMPVDSLAAYWPLGLAENARTWVTGNLRDGIVTDARVSVSARRGPDGAFVIDSLDGTIHPEGVTVDYLHPMPPVKNVRAVASFDARTFRIDVDSGEVYGLAVKDGMIVLDDLDKEDNTADIALRIDGPLADALTLIDHEPLGYTAKLGISPKKVKGQAEVDLRLKFPLVMDLDLDELEVETKAKARDVALPAVVMGLDLTKGNLALQLDAKGMDVSGPVVLGTIPAQLNWRENFAAKAEFRSRYRLQAVVQEHQRPELRLDGVPFVAPWMSGPVKADVTATMLGGGKGRVDAKLDLAAAGMELPGLGWRKEPGVPGSAHVDLRLDKERLSAIPRFTVEAADLAVAGAVEFDSAGDARRVAFERLRYGRTDAHGSLRLRRGGGLDIELRGASFDAAPMLGGDTQAEAAAQPRPPTDDDLPPMGVALDVDRLWLGESAGFDRATASLGRDGRLWRTARLEALVAPNRPIVMTMSPAGSTRVFNVAADDAGAVFRALDIFENVSGGRLTVRGTVDDGPTGDVISGTAEVRDYRLVKAPVLAKVLSVAALTGIADVLRGEGIAFSNLEAPFKLKDGLLELSETRAYGSALGITAKGQIDLSAERMAVEGTIVPMYALNSALGKIPLLGQLLTGEKGGGVFAATFAVHGPSADPAVTVNPLAALTPGMLRKFFDLFSAGTTARPEAAEAPAQTRSSNPAAAPAQ